ncbi:MAG: SRPBCC domain-containing protein, partial [Rhodobacteraceae bacterium]|nr:SRPBCC domain-containing protein [Paracoccaceae bacterium]
MFDVNPATDLTIERLMKCRPETIWRCWSEPELVKQWFTPPG